MVQAQTIAILSPGSMGHAVGAALKDEGHRIVTCLNERSERTRDLARLAGFFLLPSLHALVAEADLVLSILPPASAVSLAREVAEAMEAASPTVYADCNAVSPETSRMIGRIIGVAGGAYVDAGIVGPPPRDHTKPTRFYISGVNTAAMAPVSGPLIELVDVGPEVGRASAIKMCYAAITKGTWTLHAAALIAAEALGISEELHSEFRYSRPAAYAEMERMTPRLPLDAGRWVGEMREIAATLSQAGVTPQFHEGAAAMFEFLDSTSIARETRETADPNRTLREALAIFAGALRKADAV